MSLGIKRFCHDETKHDCVHCAGWEVDGVGEFGEHTIWFEYECQYPCDGCEYENNRVAKKCRESKSASDAKGDK